MAAPTTFDTGYPQNPWAGIDTKTRPFYVPDLYRVYSRQAIYNRFVDVRFNMNGMGATEMYLDNILMPHANHDPIGNRDQWVDSSYMDTMRRKITFRTYAGKMSYHEYDDLITFYKLDNQRGLTRIVQEGLGQMMTWSMDKLARDAFLRAPYALYGGGTGVDFGDLVDTDVFTTTLIDDINLGMKERDVPFAQNYTGDPGNIICITSPGAIRDLKQETNSSGGVHNTWIESRIYSDGAKLQANETGMYHGVRFIETNDAVLWNCGAVTAQTAIKAPIAAGDGAPSPSGTVDDVFYVGQSGKTHTITVASSSGFTVGDRVSIHVDRTNDFGVTNGADYRDGKFTTRRIVSIPDGTHLVFDRPLMEDFEDDLGGTVYGYITLGANVHTALFLGARDGVALGVLTPPEAYVLPPVDDLRSQYRSVWKGRFGYNLFNPLGFEVVYLKGSNREKGRRYTR